MARKLDRRRPGGGGPSPPFPTLSEDGDGYPGVITIGVDRA